MIHVTAEVSPKSQIGECSKIWHYAQIREGVTLGENCVVGKGVYIDFDVSIGSNVKIQNGALIYHGVTIEDGVFIGPYVCFCNDKFPRAINSNGILKNKDDWGVGTVLVKYGASLGAGAIIVPSVTIGRFAMIGAAIGVTLMVVGHLTGGSIKGAGLSVGCAVTVSIFAVILRWGRDLDMIPMFAVGSLIAAAIALPFSFDDPSLNGKSIAILVFWGGLISPIYYSLFVVASRHIRAGELMLIVPLETILAVLLAWLVLAEIPSANSLVGGILIIVAVSGMAIYRIYERPPGETSRPS